MAPTARSPPYFSREELKQSVRILSVACMINGAMPSAIQGRSTEGWIRKFFLRSFSTVVFPERKRIAQTALTAWEMIVARAAPLTPIWKPKMKIGSRTMFVTAPMMTVSILILENP